SKHPPPSYGLAKMSDLSTERIITHQVNRDEHCIKNEKINKESYVSFYKAIDVVPAFYFHLARMRKYVYQKQNEVSLAGSGKCPQRISNACHQWHLLLS